jgi:hypothetical protein
VLLSDRGNVDSAGRVSDLFVGDQEVIAKDKEAEAAYYSGFMMAEAAVVASQVGKWG